MKSPLPELSVWKARSTYAYAVLVGVWALKVAGYDPEPIFAALHMPPEVMTEVLYQGVPVLALIWAWIERKAPRFKLVFWRS